MDDQTAVELVYITIAPNREKVLKAFKDADMLRPSQIANQLDMHINKVSFNLKKLREKEYVYLVNPEVRKPRYYKLTAIGRKILNLL